MVKNSNPPLIYSLKFDASRVGVKNNMGLRDFDDSGIEDVKGKEHERIGLNGFDELCKTDVDCNKTELRVSEMDDSLTVDSAAGYDGEQVGIENIGLKSYEESSKKVDEIRKNKQRTCLGKLCSDGEIIDGPKGSKLDKNLCERGL